MKLNIAKKIEENIITVDITVIELGTVDTQECVELEMLHDFVRSVEYSKIQFKANMREDNNGDPVVTEDVLSDDAVVSVELKDLINKSHVIDENMHISFTIDVTKIPESELGKPFDTVEKLGKAKAVLFATKIQEEIGKKLSEIRALNTKFEGDTEVVL